MEKILAVEDNSFVSSVFGIEDKNVKLLEKELGVSVLFKPEGICVKGERVKVENAVGFINRLIGLGKEGIIFSRQELKEYITSMLAGNNQGVSHRKQKNTYEGIKVPSIRKKIILPKTKGQQSYVQAMREYDIVFSIGPAGTGKTYLAMAMAVNYLMEKRARRIVLTRPAIEAGESLGFLPGGMTEKLGPYLRPLYDAIYDMMEIDVIEDHLETGVIEIAPLAYMRGRTLNNAFVILDEAQNCSAEQLKMFLTRLGFDSKTVITGDITQSDLPGGKPAGLLEAVNILKPIRDIKFIDLTGKDVVRHPLIQKIVQAYETFYTEKTN